MNLQDIKGSYDLIVSLGSACNPSLQLNRLNLRSFTSSPLDWSYSPFLSDVNRLLCNKFDGFMEIDNMRLIDDAGNSVYIDNNVLKYPNQNIHVQKKSYIIQDTRYNIFSAHDFPILQNKHWTATYPKYKRNLNYRVSRFMKRIMNSESILFIRWVAEYEQTVELQSILFEITKGNFKILILNPIDNLKGPVEINWEIDKVCNVNVPTDPNSISTWDYVLNGITLTH